MNIGRTIDALIGHLEFLRHELDTAETILLDQRRRIDTWTTDTADNPGRVTGGGEPTSTIERAVLARTAIDTQLRSHREELHAAELTVRNLRNDCQRTMRHEGAAFELELPAPPRCDAAGRDGAIEWADPTCTNVPSRGPLCDRCSKREYRWRTRHDLPPRRDGVFAGDLNDTGGRD
ncbi:MAG: hypothetical protein WKF64_08430 [Ilumatobacteraceae bacterium]